MHFSVLALALLLAPAGAREPDPNSALKVLCHYKYGAGNYQDVSHNGRTSCVEAGRLIGNFTADGTREPRLGKRTGRSPRGKWSCVTVHREEVHGVILSSHRITCSLLGGTAKVRFFYEG